MEILTQVYTVHQNLLAISILLICLIVFLAMKKNFKLAIPFMILFIVVNVFCYKQTANKAWERQFLVTDTYPKSFLIYDKINDSIPVIKFTDSIKVVFNAMKHESWVIDAIDSTNIKYKLHWCWVDNYWESFTQTDLVSWIWGENAGKKVRGSSEARFNATLE